MHGCSTNFSNWASISSEGFVSIVGAGPGDPGLLTLRAARALQSANVVLYDALVDEAILAFAPEFCEKIYVGKRAGAHAMAQHQIETLMIERAQNGQRVVRLKGGDPFLFGRGGEEAQALRGAGVRFEIVPGITSALAAPAYAGIPVTHRAYNTAVTIATGHEDPAKAQATLDWRALSGTHQTLVFLMAAGNLEAIVRHLLDAGVPAWRDAAVVERGTRPDQRTVASSLERIATETKAAGIEAPAVFIVGEVAKLRDQINWFERLPLFSKRVLVTRPAHQNEEFARALRDLGAQPILAPTIETAPPHDPTEIARGVDAACNANCAVFTSRNGVDVFFTELGRRNCDARALGGVKVAAIGPKTARALKGYGIAPEIVPDRYISEAVAEAIRAALPPQSKIVLFRARGARDALRVLLAESYDVDEYSAYDTRYVTDPQFAQKVARSDVMTFTSASTVQGFFQQFESPQAALAAAMDKVVACIGPITAGEATQRGLHVDVVASDYTEEGLLCALQAHCSSPAA